MLVARLFYVYLVLCAVLTTLYFPLIWCFIACGISRYLLNLAFVNSLMLCLVDVIFQSLEGVLYFVSLFCLWYWAWVTVELSLELVLIFVLETLLSVIFLNIFVSIRYYWVLFLSPFLYYILPVDIDFLTYRRYQGYLIGFRLGSRCVLRVRCLRYLVLIPSFFLIVFQ